MSESGVCFVIMPFGKKVDASGVELDFDRIYQQVIVPPVTAAGYQAVRCDEIQHAGNIARDMFGYIATAPLAIVDISMLNPNVFYELGVRHALCSSITVLIKYEGCDVPFNIQNERVIDYPTDPDNSAQAISAIESFIRAGRAQNSVDSPIFSILQEAQKDWKAARIDELQRYVYQHEALPGKQLCVVTGDMRKVKGIDVWVNSENTNLQMSRFFDRSLSATIRFEGALKDDNDDIVDDVIARELNQLRGDKESVSPGSIYVTGAGSLQQRLGVRRVFHAASVIGVPGSGYQAMLEVERCVTNSLRRMDHQRYQQEGLSSIVFPMLGTGSGGGRVDEVAPRLLRAAVEYLRENPDSRVNSVYFSAWNKRDLDACQAAMRDVGATQLD